MGFSYQPMTMRAQRECVNCARMFPIALVGKNRTVSRARTCGRRCQNELRSWAMIQAHRTAQQNPAQYQRWVGRDWVAMGQARLRSGPSMREIALIKHHGRNIKGETEATKQSRP